METLIISEQDIINSLCIYHARQKNIMPEEVEVELLYDDQDGYSAEAHVNGQQDVYREANMIAAIRIWLKEYLNLDPYAASIQLELDDEQGIIAIVE